MLAAPIQRYLLSDVESIRLAKLIDRTRGLLMRSYREIGHNNVFLSFNGGKDSVTVFHLYRLAALTTAKELNNPSTLPLNVVYFKEQGIREFAEIIDFMYRTAAKYNFTLQVIEGDWRSGIPKLPTSNKKAFILGARNSDSDIQQLSEIQEGVVDGVGFTRIHPIVDWSYGDVWNFIRLFSLEYCSLYDRGYTSIGSIDDTIANPHLRNPDGSYSPAYTLKDWYLERCGRIMS